MRRAVVLVLGLAGCGPGSGGNPDYPLPVFPPQLTVTEGDSTGFVLGLTGGPVSGASAGMYVGSSLCAGIPVRFTPCEFTLGDAAHYPVMVNVSAPIDTDAVSDVVGTNVYLFGEIDEPGHMMSVTVVDADAPNPIATSWFVTLEPGGSADIGVRLAQAPADTVTVTLAPPIDGSLQVAPASLTFTPQDFGGEQHATVTGTPAFRYESVQLVVGTAMPVGAIVIAPPFSDGR